MYYLQHTRNKITFPRRKESSGRGKWASTSRAAPPAPFVAISRAPGPTDNLHVRFPRPSVSFPSEKLHWSNIKDVCIVWIFSLAALFLPGEVFGQEASSTIERADPPQRIVSLAPSVTETLFALGAGDRLVGVTTFCDYPPRARLVPKIGSFISPSVEAVLAKQPDLVVGVRETDREKIKRMERMGLRVVVISVTSLKDTFESIHSLAGIVGREEAGEKLLSQLQGQIDRIRTRIAGAQRRRVLMLVGLRPLVAVGKGTYIDELLTLAGGDNIAAVAAQPWPHLPMEYVVAKAPHVIIEGGMGSEQGARSEHWDNLSSIPAVKEGRIYAFHSDRIVRPGPRVGEALEEIARLIHPECFAKDGKESGCEGP